MEAKIVQRGHTIDYTPNSDVSAGDVVPMHSMCGVALTDIRAGETGAIAIEGVVEVPRLTGFGSDWVIGRPIFWENNQATGFGSSEKTPMGFSIKAAAEDDATGLVKLQPFKA